MAEMFFTFVFFTIASVLVLGAVYLYVKNILAIVAFLKGQEFKWIILLRFWGIFCIPIGIIMGLV